MPLQIGQVAKSAGVAIDTIRYYEKRGLLPAPERRASGFRSYGPETIERIRLIKQVQDLGLTLDEIGELIDAVSEAHVDCAHERPRLATALDRIDAKIAALKAVQRKLRGALTKCDAGTCDLVERARRMSPRRRLA